MVNPGALCCVKCRMQVEVIETSRHPSGTRVVHFLCACGARVQYIHIGRNLEFQRA
jgi:hypothetical protein